MFTLTCLHRYLYPHIHLFKRKATDRYVNIYIYAHIHMYAHAYIHACKIADNFPRHWRLRHGPRKRPDRIGSPHQAPAWLGNSVRRLSLAARSSAHLKTCNLSSVEGREHLRRLWRRYSQDTAQWCVFLTSDLAVCQKTYSQEQPKTAVTYPSLELRLLHCLAP